MSKDELSITISSLVEVSTMLGLHLEDFSPIRLRQDDNLIQELQAQSTVKLAESSQRKHFYLTAIDFLTCLENGQKKFKFTEINGSGFTGISNISEFAIKTVLNELEKMPDYLTDKNPMIAVPCSGTKEISTSGRPSLMYEKILFAQAIKQGFQKHLGSSDLVTLYDVNQTEFKPDKPTVIFGYLMDFMKYLSCIDGKIHLLDYPLSGGTHDRFCDNVINAYKAEVDINKFYSANNIFYITSDKGNAYNFYHDFIKNQNFPSFDKQFSFKRVFSRDELISGVMERINGGHKTVIKPHGAALGRGIEFFVKPESEEHIIEKIDSSMQAVNRFCGVEGWAFPYTIVDFMDCCTIPNRDYPLFGHKYEMRVIVYRDNDELKAFPSIVKISSKEYDKENPDRLMLLNNVAAAAGRTKMESFNYMLPLTNYKTLEILDLPKEQLIELCRFSTEFVRYAIDRVDKVPVNLMEHYTNSVIWP